MKNKIFHTYIFIFVLCLSLKAQKPEPVIATVKYKFFHLQDTTNLANVNTEDMILCIGKAASMYLSYSQFMQDSIQLRNKRSTADIINMSLVGSGSKTAYFFYPLEHKWFQKEKMFMNNYLFPIDYPEIKWDISSDTMSLSGLKCQKASGYWKGRTYIAWFCPDLPFSYGPWKLSGLPGLIVEAYDTKRQIIFKFAGFKNNKDANVIIEPSTDKLVKLTKLEYDRLQQLFNDNPKAYLEYVLGSQYMNSVIISPSFAGSKPTKNPIELEDKK